MTEVNLSKGNSGLCPCCKGTRLVRGETCYYCNGSGFKRNLTGTDAQGLPTNNSTVPVAKNNNLNGNDGDIGY